MTGQAGWIAGWLRTGQTLLVGLAGAGLGWLLSLPIYPLIGPAILISAASLAGARFDIVRPVRDGAFLLMGISIGAGVNPSAVDAMQRWPLAFFALGLSLIATVLTCRWLLWRMFGFSRTDALLAASPGHLSYVLSVGVSLGRDVTPIAIVQSIRLLALTLIVPFVALMMGIEVNRALRLEGAPFGLWDFAALAVLSVLLSLLFQRLRVPAAIFIAAMTVSALAHASGLSKGVLPGWALTLSYVVLGTLIGSRFVGVSLRALGRHAGAGLVNVTVTVLLSVAAALPVAWYLGMDAGHVLTAFAPGGLETMIAMGAILGASPGFVAAAHVFRLMVLSVLVPFLLGRGSEPPATL